MRIEILVRVKFEFDLEDISIWKRVKYVHLGNEKETVWNVEYKNRIENVE